MLSIQLIREHPEVVERAMARRHSDTPLDEILALDADRRKLLQEADTLKARRNEVSRNIGRSRQESPEAFEQTREEMRQVGDQISALEAQIADKETRLNDLLLMLPNLPDDSVPEGEDESGNLVLRTEGTPPSFDFETQAHWDMGERLDIIDFQRGVKLSGSRFYVLKGPGRAAAAGPHHLDAGLPHQPRLRRDLPACAGQVRGHARRGPAPQVL